MGRHSTAQHNIVENVSQKARCHRILCVQFRAILHVFLLDIDRVRAISSTFCGAECAHFGRSGLFLREISLFILKLAGNMDTRKTLGPNNGITAGY